MANPQHVTLVSGAPSTLTLDEDFAAVEVFNRGTVDVSCRLDATDPGVVGTAGSFVVPAGSIRRLRVRSSGATKVSLEAVGTPAVEVYGIRLDDA